ncbi:MAG: hypothetical protein KDB90_09010 [Planctomycetes bacterium]|nr:hypothetical protein [Planctomycetota bacterium]
MSEQEWPFVDEPDVSVLTTRQIIEQGAPIMCVTHDLEDGMWQFLHSDEVDEGDVLLVTLESVLALDAALGELWDLEPGWLAARESAEEGWERAYVGDLDEEE